MRQSFDSLVSGVAQRDCVLQFDAMKRLSFFLAVMPFLCSAVAQTPPEVPQKAVLEDYITQINEKESEAMFCVVTQINGKRVPNALDETRTRSYGKGNKFYFYLTDRKLDPGPVKVTLRCEYAYARPIDSMFGKTPSLEGTLDFEPEAGKEYEVRADLEGPDWAIWIREVKSRYPVTKVVYGIPSK